MNSDAAVDLGPSASVWMDEFERHFAFPFTPVVLRISVDAFASAEEVVWFRDQGERADALEALDNRVLIGGVR